MTFTRKDAIRIGMESAIWNRMRPEQKLDFVRYFCEQQPARRLGDVAAVAADVWIPARLIRRI
jgi:hypothetical protein